VGEVALLIKCRPQQMQYLSIVRLGPGNGGQHGYRCVDLAGAEQRLRLLDCSGIGLPLCRLIFLSQPCAARQDNRNQR